MKNKLVQALEDFDKEDQKSDLFDEEPQEEPAPPLTEEQQKKADAESDQAVATALKQMTVGSVVCSIIACAVFAFLGRFDFGVLYGVIGGSVVALFNFLYLGRSVQAALSMGEKGTLYMRRTYNIRVLIHAAWVVLCFKLPMINAIAGVLALFFPRITIFGMQMAGMYKPSK